MLKYLPSRHLLERLLDIELQFWIRNLKHQKVENRNNREILGTEKTTSH